MNALLWLELKIQLKDAYCWSEYTGKLVEEEEGNFALWMSYILTGAGANLISWLALPTSSVSLGASGAVFGLFTISVLVKVINSILSFWNFFS
jgi:membrane associated rhomboid family serine protease